MPTETPMNRPNDYRQSMPHVLFPCFVVFVFASNKLDRFLGSVFCAALGKFLLLVTIGRKSFVCSTNLIDSICLEGGEYHESERVSELRKDAGKNEIRCKFERKRCRQLRKIV